MRNQIFLGDSVEILKEFPDASVSHTVTDPPYGLGTKEPTAEEVEAFLAGHKGLKTGDFMGAKWDLPSVALWREVYRVMKPGGIVCAFAGTRTLDLMAAGLEAAGFRYMGVLGWVHCLTEDAEILTDAGWLPIVSALEGRKVMCYDVDEDTFALEPIERQYIYQYTGDVIRLRGNHSDHRVTPDHRVLVLTENGEHEFMLAHELEQETDIPTLEDEEGMLLCWDRVDVTREPYRGLVGCVTTPTGTFVARQKGQPFVTGNSQGFPKSLSVGRAIDKMQRGAPQGGPDPLKRGKGDLPERRALQKGGATGKATTGLTTEYDPFVPTTEEAKKWEGYGTALKPAFEPILVFSKGETDWVMPAVPFCYSAKAGKSEKNLQGDLDNNHVTVKPLKLMEWLVGQVGQPGQIILDPFVGSGTTAAACVAQGVDFVAIERDPHYHEIASKRVGVLKGRAKEVLNQRLAFEAIDELPQE